MKTLLLALLVAVSAAAQSHEVRAPSQFDLKLTNGFTMKQCKIVGWGNGFVTLAYVGGTVDVRMTNVAEGDKPKLVEEVKVAQEFAGVQRELAARAQPQDSTPAQPAARTDEQTDAISHGVFYHQLVVGMNQEEAVKAMGASPTERIGGEPVVMLRYWRRGARNGLRSEDRICDRYLTFVNGKLTKWEDF